MYIVQVLHVRYVLRWFCVSYTTLIFSLFSPPECTLSPPHVIQTINTEKENEYANAFALSPDPALTDDEIEESHMQVCIMMMEKSVKYLFSTFAEVISLLLLLPQEDFC